MPRVITAFAEFKDTFTKLDLAGRRFILDWPVDQIVKRGIRIKYGKPFQDAYLADDFGQLGKPFCLVPSGKHRIKLLFKSQPSFWSYEGRLPDSPTPMQIWVKVQTWQPSLHWLLNPREQHSIEYWLLVAQRLGLDRLISHSVAVWIYRGRCNIKI